MYKLEGELDFQGLNIKVENKKGSVRSGVDPNGQSWSIKMAYPYGYIAKTEGVDGDAVDVYVGDNEHSQEVFVIHQLDPWTGLYDEDKVMLGFDTAKQAKEAYLSHYTSSRFFGWMTYMSMFEFKQSLLINRGHLIK